MPEVVLSLPTRASTLDTLVDKLRARRLLWKAAKKSKVYCISHLGDQAGSLDQDHVEAIAKQRRDPDVR